jgi:hypothetical protein
MVNVHTHTQTHTHTLYPSKKHMVKKLPESHIKSGKKNKMTVQS